MTYVIAQPAMLAAAAADVAGIGSAIDEANAAAAGPTTGVLAAAGDEVSTAVAKAFGAFGAQFEAITNQLAAFYNDFAQVLVSAAGGYIDAEATNAANLVGSATSALPTPARPLSSYAPTGSDIALVMGGTGEPIPSQRYINNVTALFIDHPGFTPAPQGLFTPENLYPITGVKSLILQTSVQEGVTILDSAITQQIMAGNHVTVFGYSQSAIISSLEIEHLISLGPNAPSPSQLNFVLIGNEMNPNGGILARFAGLNIGSIGLPFYGATPDNPYPTTNYTLEYDGFADFPRYPLDVVSDLNALVGVITVHTTYAGLTPAQLTTAIKLPVSGTTSNTYWMIPTEHLPLLSPLRAIPVVGTPMADLIEPDLRVIVNLGYGDPNYGWSTSPANVPTPFGLFPDVNPLTVANDLIVGAQVGVQNFVHDLPAAVATPIRVPRFSLPYVEALLPPPPPAVPATPTNLVNTAVSIVSTDYGVLLPTADLGAAVFVTLPVYDAGLALSQLAQGNLINAIGYPFAASAGLASLAGLIEFITVAEAAISNVRDIQALTF